MQNIHRLHKANLEILANQYQLANIKDNISLMVCNSFLQILFNKESLKNLETQYNLTKQSLQRTEKLVASGVSPKGDLLDVEATLANQEQQIVQMKNNLLVSKLTLANVLMLDDALSFDVADNFSQVPMYSKTPNSPQKIFSEALKFRNEIKISEVAIEMREKDVKIAKGNYLPTLSGSFGFNTNYFNSELLNLPGFSTQIENNKGHSFGLNLSVPVFNRFKTSNGVKRSKIMLKKARLELKNSKADLKDKIYQAYADKEGAFKTYMAALKTAKARKEAYTYAKEKHEVGLLNSFDLSQMQTNLENAETEVIRAKYDYIFKIKILEFYFGIPIDKI
jgi:outer membrane protein